MVSLSGARRGRACHNNTASGVILPEPMEARTEPFASTRPLLFAIAYRRLGGVMHTGNLVAVRARQAGNLRGPLAPGAACDRSHARSLERSGAGGIALNRLLVLPERLSPLERAVFLLLEVFDFDYTEIARI